MTTWWDYNYQYCQQLPIVNNESLAISASYAVDITVNTSALIADGKMLANGDDLRIVYWNGSSYVEIDRHLIDVGTESSVIRFKTSSSISGAATDENYYMYYGHSGAVNPLSNKSLIYEYWHDFDNTTGWELASGTANCSDSVCSFYGTGPAMLYKSMGVTGATKMKQLWIKINPSNPGGWNNRSGYWGMQINPSTSYYCGFQCCTSPTVEKNIIAASGDTYVNGCRGLVNPGAGTATTGTEYTPDNAYAIYKMKWGNGVNKVIENTTERVSTADNVGGAVANNMYIVFESHTNDPMLIDWVAWSPFTNNEPSVSSRGESRKPANRKTYRKVVRVRGLRKMYV